MDPRYEDEKMVLVEINGLIDVKDGSQWINTNHNITYTTIWKEREQDSCNYHPIKSI